MKIDRRRFLALGLGATAGTVFTPLPWKLVDDVSIWTQNWRWLPVPERGEVTFETGTCTLCPGGCGISVRKVGERVVKIEGLKGHPVNDGNVCALGISGPQLLYGENRITSPMKRSRKKGWAQISWDEAIEEVAGKINALVENDEQESIACIAGTSCGTTPMLFKRLLAALGSPNFMTIPTISDSYSATIRKMHGVSGPVEPSFDFDNTGFLLSFGSGIVEGWGSPLRMIKVANAWKEKNIPIVQVESRLSATAAFTGNLVAVKPGTEADLALGLASVIISDNLHSINAAGASGFSGFAAMVKDNYNAGKVSEKTGLAAGVIEGLARKFADPSNRSLAICGRGKGTTPGSMREFMAVHALNALVGRVNVSGGIFTVTPHDYISWARDSVMKGVAEKTRIDEAGSDSFSFADSLLNRLPGKITEDGASIGLLLVTEANPVYSLGNTEQIKAAFKNIPYIVSFSSYMDETAQMADIILPNHTYLERYEDIPVRAGLSKPLINLARPVISPQYDTQNSADAIISIAKAVEGDVPDAFPWENYEECLEQTLGDKWDSMKEKGYWAGDSFNVTGRGFTFPSELPDATDGGSGEKNLPLVLIAKESMGLWSGIVASPPFALKTVSDADLKGHDTVVEINPKTGRSMGLTNGKYGILTTSAGSAKVRISFFEGIMEGVAAIPKGLGHTAFGKSLADKGVSIETLIAPEEDPVSGLNAATFTRADLKRA